LLPAQNHFGDAGVRIFTQSLKEGQHSILKDLKLADNRISANGAHMLASCICNGLLSSLTALDLEDNDISQSGVAALSCAWKNGRQNSVALVRPTGAGDLVDTIGRPCESLMLGDSKEICPRVFPSKPLQLHRALPLRSLRLGRNHLGDEGMIHLASVFQGRHLPFLQQLGLANNNISCYGAQVLFKAFREGEEPLELTVLEFGNNVSGHIGMATLASCIHQGMLPMLTELRMESNGIGEEGGHHLGKGLRPSAMGGGCPSLRVLSLGHNKLGSPGMGALADAFQAGACPELTVLGLNSNGIQDDGVWQLAHAISNGACPNLQNLELFGNEVQSEGLRRLAVSFREHCRSLRVLDLGRPNIGPVGIQALGAYFLAAVLTDGAFPALRALHLGGNGIGRSGCYMLHIAFRNRTCCELEVLDLDSNMIGDIGAGYLAIAFRRGGCPKVRCLRLGGCAIGDTGIHRLAQAFTCRPIEQRNIQTLTLANNNITSEGVDRFCQQVRLGAFPSLRTLDLDKNRASDVGLAAIGKCFEAGKLRSLITLSIYDNHVTDGGITSLALSLKVASTTRRCSSIVLRSLKLGCNQITGLGLSNLTESLSGQACPSLETLDVSRNLLCDYAATALSSMLRTSRGSLRDINLSFNHIGLEGVKILTEGLCNTNASLRRLQLEGNRLDVNAKTILINFLKSPFCLPLLYSIGGT